MKNILLIDVDDTLLNFTLGEKIAVKQALSDLGLPSSNEVATLYHEMNKKVWREFEAGRITQAELVVLRYQLLLDNLGVSHISAAELNNVYCNHLAEQHEYMQGAKEFILFIKKYYRVILISNGTSFIQKKRLEDSGLGKLCERNFVSGDMGVRKPMVEYFDAVAAQTPDFIKENSVVVGDSLSSDIAGASNYGITSVWFNPKGKVGNADYIVSNYEELKDLLLALNRCD